MFLDSVVESNFKDAQKQTYRLSYKQGYPGYGTFGKDLWGYFTLIPDGIAGAGYRETSPAYCTYDILQKMSLPTGGSLLFDFESNEYSYIGDTPVTDFSGNPLNWTAQSAQKVLTVIDVKQAFFTIATAQQVIFDTYVTTPDPISDWRFRLFNASNQEVAMLSYVPMENEPPPTAFAVYLPAGTYSVNFSSVDDNFRTPFTADITAHYKISSGANKQYLFGGGVRIGRIGFFTEGNVPQNYYDSPTGFTPAKEKKYNYRSFAQSAKSSGSLAFGVPLFDYTHQKTHFIEFTCAHGGNPCIEYELPILYRYFTDFNSLQAQRTKGSDIGYQNTTVSETGNGRTEYTYISPIDVPEDEEAYSITYPFFPSENLDHRRGQLSKEEVFDNASKILARTEYAYETVDEAHDRTLIGIRPFYSGAGCPTSFKFSTYDNYLYWMQQCTIAPYGQCLWICGPSSSFIGYKAIHEAYGWTKLIGKTTKQFFGTASTEVKTAESYSYNALNKKIDSLTTTLRTGEVLKTDFFYHTGNSPYSQNRISEIERIDSYRNSELLSSTKIGYSNSFAGNASWLPQTVQASKGANALETKIRYNSYDAYGHPLEVQQENGMKVSYVWGYNKTQPVAKIDDMAYASLPAGLITAVQNASNAVPYDNSAEASLLSALEDLRIAATASGGQMTGYAFRPLVGVSAVIDPKGDRAYYGYDGFGRLASAKDRNGKLLSENKYHYRTSLTDQNYIETATYKIETASSLPMPTAAQAIQSIAYFDGLGRPIQQRAHRQSGTGKDLVTPIVYDALGRQAKEYLPYPTTSASLAYDSNAENAALSYYASVPSPAVGGFETTANPFSEKLFEASPLNRVLKQAAPGDAWAMGLGHEVTTDYLANATDEVKYYKALAGTLTNGYYPATLSQQGNYTIGELYKTVTKDENWAPASGNSHTVQEFKDKEGRVVLKRTFGSSIVNGNPSEGWHDTYYVYDPFGNLSFVLPPLSDGSGSTQDLDGLCYQYRYDKRNRLVEKKLPGKDWELIVYDNLDRVIATGPALSPFSNLTGTGWLFTKYDAFNRVAYTGWMPATVTSAERATLQAARDAQVSNLSEAKSASSTRVNGVAFRYTNTAWPTGTGWHVLTVSYYDDYDYIAAPASFSDVEGQAVYYNLTVKPTGLPTGTWTRILETSALVKGETSYMLYDHKARPIRTWTDNYLGGYTQADSKLDFSGKTLYTVATHRRAVTGAVMTVREDFTYSDQDRLLTHTHTINSNPTELLAKNEYDERGQLVSKKVGGADLTGNAAFQKVDYAYTVRGWLKAINDTGSLTQAGAPLDLFSFKINYGQVENTTGYEVKPLYNGNIAETFWKTASDSHLRSYDYAYDALNRLNRAFYQKNGQATHSYNEDILYDKNGNIRSLNRNGGSDSHIAAQGIDVLSYTYDTQKPNQLRKVLDTYNSPQGFDDDSDGITDPDDDYAYDGFGNLTSDQNKGITSITYNHLNLPVKIVFGSPSWKIEYLYAADGRKVRKDAPYLDGSAVGGISTMSMDYLGGFHYQGTTLKFFPTTEGYVQKTGTQYSYVYNYTDHLGNIRLSYAQDPENPNVLKIIEESHYYPFGLKHANYNSDQLGFREKDPGPGLVLMAAAAPVNPGPQFVYNYKYNGKEFQDELGLNLYDYGARNYDPAIGRWQTMDNLSELYFDKSSYVYALNTPVQAIDPDGNVVIFINGQHTGDGGKSDYWRHSTVEEKYYPSAYGYMRSVQTVSHQFDSEVMSQLGDRNALYKDGAMGGFNNTLWETNQSRINLSSANRIQGGYDQGKKDAKSIIANLARDKTTGEIVETIKIITHSMGGSYGKGYVKALKEYIKTLPKEQQAQVKITLVADFDPFQAGSLKADKDIFTQQFTHLGNLAEQKQEGVDDYYEEKGDHSITTFFSSISNLQEGTYKWNGSEWQCTTCK
ncbi:DUF6443 domain-containing protein [Flavobacterium sp. WW92]|uniref:DUF6443 domain-containing protein n=1 Tax=unclassified Flavobacterium TaxID=196869 RepID=UPI0022249CF0|nr:MULTISPECIES: DUF6443 domain-containing protein [unclassified Flavobacterium]WDO13614.1 DUF6443 domain-containing protein [Flavobacterium sp. WW92]